MQQAITIFLDKWTETKIPDINLIVKEYNIKRIDNLVPGEYRITLKIYTVYSMENTELPIVVENSINTINQNRRNSFIEKSTGDLFILKELAKHLEDEFISELKELGAE